MKTTFIRLFALALLASSISGFAATTPSKDEPAGCPPATAGNAQMAGDHSKEEKKMKHKQEMKDMKQKKDNKQNKDDKYDPLAGIWG